MVCAILVLFLGISVVPIVGSSLPMEKHVSTDNKMLYIQASSGGKTSYVDGDGPGNYSTIQAAINDGDILWSFQTAGWIYSTPAIDDNNNIYVGSYHALYKIDSSGNLVWTFPTDGWVSSSPTIAEDGTVYFGGGAENPPNPIPGWGWVIGGDPSLYAVNPNGTLKWSYNAGASVDYSSPALSHNQDTVYIATGVSGSKGASAIHAIDSKTGQKKWSYPVGYWIFSAPAVARDGTIYVGTMNHEHELYALNPDGTLNWTYDVNGWIVSSPAIDEDGTIYVGTFDTSNSVIAINPDGSLKWSYPAGYFIRHTSPAIGIDGTIYIGTTDAQGKSFLALNPNGSLKWSFTTGYWVESQITIGNTGTIYFAAMDGTFYAIQDLNTHPDILWTFETGYWTRGGSAICNGVLYFGSYSGFLYAIKVSDNGLYYSPWPKYQKNLKNTGSYLNPPIAPTISGPTKGDVGKSYDYEFVATDPDGDDIEYFIDWGDGNTEWTSSVASGTPVIVNHTWNEKGTFTIKAKAKDIHGLESDWGTMEVTMPRSRLLLLNTFLQRILERFPNAFPLLRQLLGL